MTVPSSSTPSCRACFVMGGELRTFGTIHGAEATPDGLMQDFESYYLPRELWDEAKGRG